MRTRSPAACFVVARLVGLTGDEDSATSLKVAQRLAQRGWRVHVLCCGLDGRPVARRLRKAGVELVRLDPGETLSEYHVRSLQGSELANHSDLVRHALQRLNAEHRFALIEFPARNGLALRSLQARRSGEAFTDVNLAVKLGTCGPWLRELDQRWPDGPDDLEADFAERYAVEHADVQIIAPGPRADWFRGLGWAIRSDALVEPPGTAPGNIDWLSQAYDDLVRAGWQRNAAPANSDRALVTVAVAHFNLGRYLPETLASLAAQTYSNLDVVVLDDGSTEAHSLAVFDVMRSRYPQFRFLWQEANAGIGATRNRGLAEAHGDYFIPMDADNIARPHMVERFVASMRRNPEAAALTCYFLAFEDSEQLRRGQYTYAYRPTGGPHVLASFRNVYGDATAIFRTAALRAVGGYEPDRDTSWEDWEAFVKLVNAGQRVEVIPEHLFYYRHLQNGFSRQTNHHANQRRILRQFFQSSPLPTAERVALWTALAGFQRRLEELADERRCLRYRIADRLHAWCDRVPGVLRGLKWLLETWPGWGRLARKAG